MLWSIQSNAQPYPFYGYTLYDYLVTANHPNGCLANYVTGLPEDSTWVNMLDYTVMTGTFGYPSMDHPGADLLLETSFHRDNYSVRMILSTGAFSGTVQVTEAMWTDVAWVNWRHIFPGCVPGMAASPRYILPLDYVDFGIFPTQEVTGIEITFLPTPGAPDFAGAYILVPICPNFNLGPDTTLCQNETMDLDATTPLATYQWQDGFPGPVYHNAGPGVYWVDVTIYDCTIRDTIIIHAYPDFPDLGPDIELCDQASIVLNATTPGATYEWQDQSTGPTYTVSEPGQYAVTITNTNCTYEDAINITYAPPVVIELGNDTAICEGDLLVLNASMPGATYEWQDQSNGSTYFVSESGQYAVTVDINGCTGEDMIEVDVLPVPFVYLGDDQNLCAGQTYYLDAFVPGATYLWQDQSTWQDFLVGDPGTYSVTVTLAQCSAEDAITIDYTPPLQINLGPDLTPCPGQTIILDATTPGATYEWQDHSTNPTFSVNTSGTYTVLVSINDCTAADTVHVSYTSSDFVHLGPDTTLCQGDSLVLDVTSSGNAYQWQDQSTGATFTAKQSGLYWVNVANGPCSDADTIQVNFTPLPVVSLGNDTSLCEGDTLLLDAFQAGANYLWQDLSTDTTFTATLPGTYTVEVSIGSCNAKDTMQLLYTSLPVVDLGQDTAICAGEFIVLDPQLPALGLTWQDQSTTSTYTVTTSGTYWVTAASGMCMASDTIAVQVITLSSIDLGADTTLCQGQSLALDPGVASAEFLWQDGSMGSTYLVNAPGQYWVSVGLGNCSSADTIVVAYVNPPLINLGNDTVICAGQSILLDATTPGITYTWQDQSNLPTYAVTSGGIYWVLISNTICEASDTIVVDEHPLPLVDLGRDTSLCQGQTILLHAGTSGTIYQWQDQTTDEFYLVTASGQYTVNVSDGLCTSADTVEITYLDVASIDLGPDTTLCFGTTILLDPHASGAQYQWQDLSTSETLMVSVPGTYWVEVSLANCSASDTVDISIGAPVLINLGPDTLLCPGDIFQLTPTPVGQSLTWQDGSTSPTFQVIQGGNYSVTANQNGCTGSDTVLVSYVVLPVIALGPDTSFCENTVLTLDATTPGATYAWQDASTEALYQVTSPGWYWVYVTVQTCTTDDSIYVDLISSPALDLGPDQMLCAGESILLNPTLDGSVIYQWSDLSSGPTYVVTEAGTYWLQITHTCGTASDSIMIEEERCDCQISMPNVFSPNGDLLNDVFAPGLSCPLASYHLSVFDRAGGLMFETHTLMQGWDGNVKNVPAQSGVYVYVLEYAFENDDAQHLYGDVTLIR